MHTGFRRIAVFWAAGGVLGLALVVTGVLVHSNAVVIAAMAVLAATAIAAGISLVVVDWPGRAGG